MEVAVENQMEDMLVYTCGCSLCSVVLYRMAQPGIIGALCADSQGLCISGDNILVFSQPPKIIILFLTLRPLF